MLTFFYDVIFMGTHKSIEEINKLLSEVLHKQFKHRGDLAEEIGVTQTTLRKWVNRSKYTFDDFNFVENKSLKKQIIEKGGVDYLKECFNKGYKISDIVKEFDGNPIYIQTLIKDLLDEEDLTKYDIGYTRYPYKKTEVIHTIIDEKGGLPYILSCKMQGMDMNDIAEEVGGNIRRTHIVKYLRDYNLNYTTFVSYENVYYVSHLGKWRGSFVDDGVVYDTKLCDSIWDALEEIRKMGRK